MDTLNNLSDFRNTQSKMLDTRLQIIKKATIDKHGSCNDIKSDEILPLQSINDIGLLNKIIDTKDFVIIPVFDDNSDIIKVYTIGLWYYWGLPEILFDFTEPVKQNQDFVHIFVNIIKQQLYKKYHNHIVIDNKTINREVFKYDTLPTEIELDLKLYNVEYVMEKMIDMDYLNKNITYMFWFYMYYMDNKENDVLYPLYKIEVEKANYTQIEKHVYDIMIEKTTERMVNLEIDDDSDLTSIESEKEDNVI